jgi:hypothetical protein
LSAKTIYSGWKNIASRGGSLVILLSKNDDLERLKLPKPDSLYIQGRLAYLQYLPQ